MISMLLMVFLSVAMALMDSPEDEIAFVDNDGAPRILRGRIKSEDDNAIYLERRDGSWTIYKRTITKIHRRGRRC